MTTRLRPFEGGRTDIQCTGCCWTLPAYTYSGFGTQERPANADHCDAVMPRIREHIESTGHQVRFINTTWQPSCGEERSSFLIGPRASQDAVA